VFSLPFNDTSKLATCPTNSPDLQPYSSWLLRGEAPSCGSRGRLRVWWVSTSCYDTMANGQRVVVLGASAKPDRYAFQAIKMLRQHGHKAIPVNPAYDEILGEPCHPNIRSVPGLIDTVTIYLGKRRSDPLVEEITGAGPKRIILNPGAENDHLANAA